MKARKDKLPLFSAKVYAVVAKIPLGQVRTYKWVAAKAGNPKAVRAVGQILRRNPYPLIIPCHRVVASGGKIGGFAWGVKNKEKLLILERHIQELMV